MIIEIIVIELRYGFLNQQNNAMREDRQLLYFLGLPRRREASLPASMMMSVNILNFGVICSFAPDMPIEYLTDPL